MRRVKFEVLQGTREDGGQSYKLTGYIGCTMVFWLAHDSRGTPLSDKRM